MVSQNIVGRGGLVCGRELDDPALQGDVEEDFVQSDVESLCVLSDEVQKIDLGGCPIFVV